MKVGDKVIVTDQPWIEGIIIKDFGNEVVIDDLSSEEEDSELEFKKSELTQAGETDEIRNSYTKRW